jgi:hypothetical protein
MFWDEIRKYIIRAEDNINIKMVASLCEHDDEFNGFTEGGNFLSC